MSADTEQALNTLEERKTRNSTIERVRNSDLQAGSPMYYYCRSCGQEMTRPETHFGAAPTHCSFCTNLISSGIITQ